MFKFRLKVLQTPFTYYGSLNHTQEVPIHLPNLHVRIPKARGYEHGPYA